jgi:hypothetical protein
MERADMEHLIGHLTVQNALKDRQIGELSCDMNHYLDEVIRLKDAIKSLGAEEEKTFQEIIETNQRSLPFADTACEKVTRLISEILREYPPGDHEEFAPLSDYLSILARAGVKVWCVKKHVLGHIAEFFWARHAELGRRGFGDLLEKRPRWCPARDEDGKASEPTSKAGQEEKENEVKRKEQQNTKSKSQKKRSRSRSPTLSEQRRPAKQARDDEYSCRDNITVAGRHHDVHCR